MEEEKDIIFDDDGIEILDFDDDIVEKSPELEEIIIEDIDPIQEIIELPIIKEDIKESEPVIEKIMPNVIVIDSTEYIINDINSLGIKLDENGFRHILITDQSHAFHSLKNLLVGNISVELVEVGN